MKTLTFALVIGAALFLTSCSTSVQLTTEPSGADVEINGQAYGKTPLNLNLTDFDFTQYSVTMRMMGYQDKTVVLEKELKTGPFIGGFFIWPFWLWCYGPMDNYNFQLIPKTGQ
ncbi:MAG: PEGA domain-containing protein [Bacteroidetes bacterium]|nr:PEGA domain-containing protein [Bacteroidota bacterium]